MVLTEWENENDSSYNHENYWNPDESEKFDRVTPLSTMYNLWAFMRIILGFALILTAMYKECQWRYNFDVISIMFTLELCHKETIVCRQSRMYFFLNDVCHIANLPKLFVMGKWLPNVSLCIFWVFYALNIPPIDV